MIINHLFTSLILLLDANAEGGLNSSCFLLLTLTVTLGLMCLDARTSTGLSIKSGFGDTISYDYRVAYVICFAMSYSAVRPGT